MDEKVMQMFSLMRSTIERLEGEIAYFELSLKDSFMSSAKRIETLSAIEQLRWYVRDINRTWQQLEEQSASPVFASPGDDRIARAQEHMKKLGDAMSKAATAKAAVMAIGELVKIIGSFAKLDPVQ